MAAQIQFAYHGDVWSSNREDRAAYSVHVVTSVRRIRDRLMASRDAGDREAAWRCMLEVGSLDLGTSSEAARALAQLTGSLLKAGVGPMTPFQFDIAIAALDSLLAVWPSTVEGWVQGDTGGHGAACLGPKEQVRPRQKIVLIVDDQVTNHVGAEMALHKANVVSLHARGGQQALDVLWQIPIDAVVLDVHMPSVDGWAVLDALRTGGLLAPPVVLYTSEPTAQVLARAATYSVEVLAKPSQRLAEKVLALMEPPPRPRSP